MTGDTDFSVRPLCWDDFAEWRRLRLTFWPDSGDDDLNSILDGSLAPGALGFHEVERIVCFRRDL